MLARYAIKVTADVNDGDYVTEITELTEKEYKDVAPLFKRVTSALKEKHGDWQTVEQGDSSKEYVEEGLLTEEEVEEFYDYIPNGEYGIHTIVSIEVYKYSEKKRIF